MPTSCLGWRRRKQADFTVDERVLERGDRFLQRTLKAPANLKDWELNQQAFTLYALAEAGGRSRTGPARCTRHEERLSNYGKAYLALALGLIDDEAAPARIKTLLADLTGRRSRARRRRTGKRAGPTTGT